MLRLFLILTGVVFALGVFLLGISGEEFPLLGTAAAARARSLKAKKAKTPGKVPPAPAPKTEASERLNQDHCVVHVHGFHHTGTGFLRSQIHELVLKGVSSVHEDTGVSEDEGQHLQTVYPAAKHRSVDRCNARGTSTINLGWMWYCPGIADTLPYQPGAKEKLFREWSKHWDLTEPYLIQKTPTLDLLLLERMKLHPTFHAVTIRHPFHFHYEKIKANPRIMFSWLDAWTHVFTNLRSGEIQKFAIVNYEGLVDEDQHAKIQESLGDLIDQACPEQVRNDHQERFLRGQSERGLELHHKDSSKFNPHKISNKMTWDQCKADPECQEWQQDLAPVLKELGYTWEMDGFYAPTKATQKDGILFSHNKLPSQALVEKMQALAVKYSPDDIGHQTFH